MKMMTIIYNFYFLDLAIIFWLLLIKSHHIYRQWMISWLKIYKVQFSQAGAYKQYNDLVKNGVDPNNIIVITPDSIAFNRR